MAWKIIFLLFCSLELRYSSFRNIVNTRQIKSQKFGKQSPSTIYVKILYTASGIQLMFTKSFSLPLPSLAGTIWERALLSCHYYVLAFPFLLCLETRNNFRYFCFNCTTFWKCREDLIPVLRSWESREGEGPANLGQTVSLTLTSLDLIPKFPVTLYNNLLTWLPLVFLSLRTRGLMTGVSSCKLSLPHTSPSKAKLQKNNSSIVRLDRFLKWFSK